MIKEAAQFYWGATKQLYYNGVKSRALKQQQAQGSKLTRAEVRFILQQRQDMWVCQLWIIKWLALMFGGRL